METLREIIPTQQNVQHLGQGTCGEGWQHEKALDEEGQALCVTLKLAFGESKTPRQHKGKHHGTHGNTREISPTQQNFQHLGQGTCLDLPENLGTSNHDHGFNRECLQHGKALD